MAKFIISSRNSRFTAQSEVDDQGGVNEATAIGIRGATQMCVDDIEIGQTTAAVHLEVKDSAGHVCRSVVVALSVAQLTVDPLP